MNSVDKVIKSFKHGLKEIYPPHEISAIIELVLEHFLSFSKIDIVLKSDFELSDIQCNTLISVLDRLIEHEPVQYIVGETYFYNLKFLIEPGVLIPRQETEELVDLIIKENRNIEQLKILDIGTGSGCIAVSLASYMLNPAVTAFDISDIAIEVASKNAKINKAIINIEKFNILNTDEQPDNLIFDIIVSNPPYVLEKEKKLMQKNVLDYEPSIALFVEDTDPLLFYKAIVKYSLKHLQTGGKLYFEINEAYGNQIERLLDANGFENIQLMKDINGKYRMASAIKQNQ